MRTVWLFKGPVCCFYISYRGSHVLMFVQLYILSHCQVSALTLTETILTFHLCFWGWNDIWCNTMLILRRTLFMWTQYTCFMTLWLWAGSSWSTGQSDDDGDDDGGQGSSWFSWCEDSIRFVWAALRSVIPPALVVCVKFNVCGWSLLLHLLMSVNVIGEITADDCNQHTASRLQPQQSGAAVSVSTHTDPQLTAGQEEPRVHNYLHNLHKCSVVQTADDFTAG